MLRLFYFAAPMKGTVDTYLHKGLRKQLVETLREKGIQDEQVLAAIESIPRHFFLDTAFEKIAYENRAFPISSGQTISHPYTVAYMTQLLQVKPFEKILEIGTGSGYQACVLAELRAQVYTIERQKELFEENKEFQLLNKYVRMKRFFGDGYLGLPTFAPFDKIIITAAAPFVPPKLTEQLKPGGLMVIPVTEGEAQRMKRLTRLPDGAYNEEVFELFSFVPMLDGKQNNT